MQRGIAYAAGAYLLWGLFPLYFRLVTQVPPAELLAQRIVWSMAFVLALLAVLRRWDWLGTVARRPALLWRFALSATLVATNWLVFIWAVMNGHVLEASLGYFINPLVNVAAGAVMLKERLRPAQWLAVAIAALGVLWLTWQTGRPPWIALTLAFSFAFYGVLRKTAALGAIEGLALETVLLAPPALAALGWMASRGELVFAQGSLGLQSLIALSGPLTAVPLLLFAAGARRIPLSLVGMLQYLGPSIQVLLGVLVFDEALHGARLGGFLFIWLACLVFCADLLRHTARDRSSAKAAAGAGIIEA